MYEYQSLNSRILVLCNGQCRTLLRCAAKKRSQLGYLGNPLVLGVLFTTVRYLFHANPDTITTNPTNLNGNVSGNL